MTAVTIHDLYSGKRIASPAPRNNIVPFPKVADGPVPSEAPLDGSPELEALLAVVSQLTDRVAWLERERTEALQVAHQLADQRDYYAGAMARTEQAFYEVCEQRDWAHAALRGMRGEVREIAESTAALLVRRRLRAASEMT